MPSTWRPINERETQGRSGLRKRPNAKRLVELRRNQLSLASQESQRDIGAKKQLTVSEDYGQREAVNKTPEVEIPPPVPPFGQLEKIAAREEPEVAGAWWIALQAAQHVIECAAERDMHTGRKSAASSPRGAEGSGRFHQDRNAPRPQRPSPSCRRART